MDTALLLFMEKGFDNTSVNDIVKKVGVAQGLFYYYFSSKYEMLNAVVERYLDRIAVSLNELMEDNSLNTEKKLVLFLEFLLKYGEKNENFAADLHRDENAIIHHKLTDKANELIPPIFLRLINEGVEKGIWSMPYSGEMLEILVLGIGDYLHKYYFSPDAGVFENKMKVLERFIEQMLGAEEGSLSLEL
ncbi:TetR/AcrR family transcriptional regulator [Anaerocolumna jejuensis]|nr:TetR/AcrR family transcriptional regulator [Anaerocolumna jejuensis]